MSFEVIDRPRRNRRHLKDSDMDWDQDIEDALRDTLETGRAVRLPLARFHSSPAKGRLWAEGFEVKHRVLPDRETVGAWLEFPGRLF